MLVVRESVGGKVKVAPVLAADSPCWFCARKTVTMSNVTLNVSGAAAKMGFTSALIPLTERTACSRPSKAL